jgi:hypothetical protein
MARKADITPSRVPCAALVAVIAATQQTDSSHSSGRSSYFAPKK